MNLIIIKILMEKNKKTNKNKIITQSINDNIFDLNSNAIDYLNGYYDDIDDRVTFSGNSALNRTTPFYQDDSIFDIKQTKTFKYKDEINFINVQKQNKRKSALLFEENKLISLLNFKKDHDFLQKSKERKENKNSTIKYITYEDTYLENEVFIPSPSSYPGEFSENNLILKRFDEDYNDMYYYDSMIMNNSFSYKTKKEDNNIYLKLTKIKETDNSFNSDIKNNSDPSFVDEKEIKGKNIQYLKGKNDNLEINNYTNIKNKNNIDYISLNLFIKKVAKENLRTKYSLLFRSFLEQFSIFLSTDIFIEKIINAFFYYKKESSYEYGELINLLNNIVCRKYNIIKANKDILKKLKNFYGKIKKSECLKDYLKEDTLNVNYILNNKEEEFDLNFIKYSISHRKKNIIFIKEKTKPNSKNTQTEKENNNSIILKNKISYFYIFDYTEEEIAISLTSICYKLISNINIEELLNNNFSKKDKNKRSPNVITFIERFDKLTLFIIEDICSYDDPNRRAEAITKWVKIAEQCRNLYNFNDVLVINTCFSNYLMRRIVLTWKKIPKSTIKSMNELRKFCSNNQCYLNMRKEIVNRRGRFYIPYLGILLKELVNLEEKYKYVLENGNINCLKVQKLYISINQFFSFKNSPFVKATLNDLDIFAHLNPKSEDQLEMMSSKIEPKLIISAGENKKRKTKTDVRYYF